MEKIESFASLLPLYHKEQDEILEMVAQNKDGKFPEDMVEYFRGIRGSRLMDMAKFFSRLGAVCFAFWLDSRTIHLDSSIIRVEKDATKH